jgi:inhibitor of KinA sporulation pathway (predicted exonuclease)
MILNVVDMEFNQPSGKIIQIGGVAIDAKTGELLDEFLTHVNPKEALDPFIIELCGISQEQVDKAPDIHDALNHFWNWTKSKSIAAWGNDHDIIIQHSQELHVESAPKSPSAYNLLEMANLLRCAYTGSKQGGLVKTMNLFGLDFIGRQHNALDDARNTARLANRMIDMVRRCVKIEEIVNEK